MRRARPALVLVCVLSEALATGCGDDHEEYEHSSEHEDGHDHHQEGHGHGGAEGPKDLSPDNIYAAQVVRDESMAENTRRWLGAGGDTMVIIAGNGHCHDSAIIRRLVRRGGGPAVSIRPIIDDGEGNVAEALAEAQNDYLFVMTMPTH